MEEQPTRTLTLFERIWSFEALMFAYRKAALGKRTRPDVIAFDYQLEWNLVRLRDQLREGTYRPGPYHRFTIADPKPRVISAAPFRDRVVHHAITDDPLLWHQVRAN